MLSVNQVFQKPAGPQAPNLSGFVERWIESLKHEALNHVIVFGLAHFDHIVREFVAYDHECRPHLGIGNQLIARTDSHPMSAIGSLDQVRCDTRLGGLLKHYECAA